MYKNEALKDNVYSIQLTYHLIEIVIHKRPAFRTIPAFSFLPVALAFVFSFANCEIFAFDYLSTKTCTLLST